MNTYNIFISHAWKYTEHYNKVVQWLNEAKEDGILKWNNYSVPAHDPLIDPNSSIWKTTLKSELKKQIHPAPIVLVLAGMYVSYSDWIDFEIDTAVNFNKYIIGIEPWGQERIPSKVSNNANITVGWNKNSVINAILNA